MLYPTNEFWELFKKTPGALSCSEAVAITNLAEKVPRGTFLELGTHKGKSALSALYGFENSGIFYLVDPIFEDENVKEEVSNTIRSGLSLTSQKVELIADLSLNEIHKHQEISYCFVDSGSHGEGLPMAEVKLLEDRIVKDGIIAFHDYKSQFAEVTEAYNYLLSTGKYDEILINWEEINKYVDENNIEIGNSSWHHQEIKNPNFVGALIKK